MASRYVRNTLLLVFLLSACFPPAISALAEGPRAGDANIPALDVFIRSVANHRADQLRGIYVPRLFAHAVVQQPAGSPGFISASRGTLTEFDDAAELGSIGLLAHNYLAGADFGRLEPGQTVYLIYGDGRTRLYRITGAWRYQALQPNSAYSAFVALPDGERLAAAGLFRRVYGHAGDLILQTCIEQAGISTWGRLFVFASPVVRRSIQQSWH